MAQKYMTVEDAAAHLGVSTRTVRTYIQQDLLSTKKQPGSPRKWLDPEEIEELRLDRQEHNATAPKIRGELLRHRAQLRRMRAELDAVMRILDTRNEPLQLRADQARGVYQACLAQLSQPGWRVDEIDPWVRVFFRISEEDFEAMMGSVNDPKPWVPFLKLVQRMTIHVSSQPAYSTSLELQRLHRELAEARRRVRISAMCFMDLYSYDMDAAIRRAGLADGSLSVQDELERALRRK
jgi:DNA-binding transcriptional MerR regulator